MNRRVRALIMAGGKSERMLASGEPTHKALVRVCGLTLLEWNVRTLLHYGFTDIVIAVSAGHDSLADFAAALDRGEASVTIYREQSPLGNAGAAREIIADADAVLMVYVDNLAAIDLRELVAFHESGGTALTVATHLHPFQIPFGKLAISGERIVGYEEKPLFPVQVSSGTCVISRRACERIPPGRPVGISELCRMLLEQGEPVGAFRHDSAWIDINDLAAVRRAEELVSRNWEAFEPLQLQ